MNESDKAFIAILIAVVASLEENKYSDGIVVIYGVIMQNVPTATEKQLDLAVQELLAIIKDNNGTALLLAKSSEVVQNLQKQCYSYAVEIALKSGTISTASQTILDTLKTDWSITTTYATAVKSVLTERVKIH